MNVDSNNHLQYYQPAAIRLERTAEDPPQRPLLHEKIPFSDLGNANRFVQLHGDKVLYCDHRRRTRPWYAWDGRRWSVDSGLAPRRLAEEVLRDIDTRVAQLRSLGNDSDADQLRKLKRSLEAKARIVSMIELTHHKVEVKLAEFDRNPWLFNVQNGTLDLEAQTRFYPHRRADLITKLSNATYNANAGCPEWLNLIDFTSNGDPEMVEYHQRLFGASLIGVADDKEVYFPYGPSNTLKSTWAAVLQDLLGEYARAMEPATLSADKAMSAAVRNDLAALVGTRAAIASELERNVGMATALVKQLTGGDTLAVRYLFEEYFDLKATFKIFVITNHLPVIRDTDDAAWNRVRVIPFKNVMPEGDRKRQTRVLARYRKELPGILNWAIEGCRKWQAEGMFVPTAVQMATDDYRFEANPVARFVREGLIAVDYQKGHPVDHVYRTYQSWCEDSGERYVYSKNDFGREMARLGYASRTQKRNGKAVRVYPFEDARLSKSNV